MVNLAGSRCFAKFRKTILTLTKARTSAQSVVKSVVIPNYNYTEIYSLFLHTQYTPQAYLEKSSGMR